MKIKNYKGILIILVSLFLVLTPANAKDKSDEQNYSEIQYNLGLAHYLKQDYKQAIYWWRKSANQGNTKAQYNFFITYYKQEQLSKDIKNKLLSIYTILLIVILFYFMLFIPLRKFYIKIRNNNNIKIFKSIILMLIPTALLLVLFVVCFVVLYIAGIYIINVL